MGSVSRGLALLAVAALASGCATTSPAGRTPSVVGQTSAPASHGAPGTVARPSSSVMPGARRLRGTHVVVVGDVSMSRLRSTLRDAQQAAGWVERTWGRVWAGRGPVTIEVPATQRQFRALGGGQSDQVSATTTPAGVVVLAPAVPTTVTTEGQVVILTHELTHVALHQAGLTDAPRWVVEGSAELTAYRPTGLTLARAAPTLAARVRAGRVPDGPPDNARFTSAAPDLQDAYQEAYAWCLFLTQRSGLRAFTRFVRRVDSAPADAPAAFHAAFDATPAELAGRYADWLRGRLRGSTSTPETATPGSVLMRPAARLRRVASLHD